MTVYNKEYYKDYSKKELLNEIVQQNYLIDNLITRRHELKEVLKNIRKKDNG